MGFGDIKLRDDQEKQKASDKRIECLSYVIIDDLLLLLLSTLTKLILALLKSAQMCL